MAGELDDAAVRRQRAAQDREAAGRLDRRLDRDDDLSGPSVSTASAAISAIVRPSTVGAVPSSRSRFSSSRMTARRRRRRTGPTRRSGRRASCRRRSGSGRRSRPNSSMSSGIPNSWAIASRWRTPFVEPPVAATDAIAFSIEARGDDRGRPDVAPDQVHHELAAAPGGVVLASGPRPGCRSGRAGERPRNSSTMLIVLAVYWPPQAPAPGQAAFSISYSSSRLILPARYAPIAS